MAWRVTTRFGMSRSIVGYVLVLLCVKRAWSYTTVGAYTLAFSLHTGWSSQDLSRRSLPRTVAGCRRLQSTTLGSGSDTMLQRIKVAIQTSGGEDSEKALRQLMGTHVVAVVCDSAEDTLGAVEGWEADYAMIPIENSLRGSIPTNYDMMLSHELFIVAEHNMRVDHCIAALPGTKLSDVATITSHPNSLERCHNFLKSVNAERVPTHDPRGAAKTIAERDLRDWAVIMSDFAVEQSELEVLAKDKDIQDIRQEADMTRFLLLGKHIDFTKIEGRPVSVKLLRFLRWKHAREARPKSPPESRGEVAASGHETARFPYCFHLDFLAADSDVTARDALAHLAEMAPFARVLGSYPKDGELPESLRKTLDGLARSEASTVMDSRNTDSTGVDLQ